MATQKDFFEENRRLKEQGNEILIDSVIGTGALVVLDGEAVIVENDYMGIIFLPEEINTEQAALDYISNAKTQQN